MIKIVSSSHQKSVANGALIADRATVTAFGVDLREGKPGSPSLNCDIAYGIEGPNGEFDAIAHDSNVLVDPFQVGPDKFALFSTASHAHQAGPPVIQKGSEWMDALAMWIEKVLVSQNEFGAGATVVPQKRRVFDPPTQPGQLGG